MIPFDITLLNEAENMTDFGDIMNLKSLAQTDYCANEIHRIGVRQYLTEQYNDYGEI